MARAIHVKKAQKDYPQHGIKKGQEYWHASFKTGPRSSIKRYFTKPPKRSQLTNSPFYQSVYGLQEDMEFFTTTDLDELESQRDAWVSEIEQIGEECKSSLDNMPEGLQQGDTGQLLQERIDAMENWSSELQSVDCSGDIDEEAEDVDDQTASRIQEILEEICFIDPGV